MADSEARSGSAIDLPRLTVPYHWQQFGAQQRDAGPAVWWALGVFMSLWPAGGVGASVAWWAGAAVLLVLWGALAYVAVRVIRQRIVLTIDGVRFESRRGVQQLAAHDLLSMSTSPAAYSRSAEHVTFASAGRRISVPISYEHSFEVHQFVRRQWPEVVINPTGPWLDRNGEWHGLTYSADPVHAVRSVRHAELGRWHVRVRVTMENGALVFQAVAHTVAGPPGLWAGARHPALRDAEDEAAHMVVTLGDTPQ